MLQKYCANNSVHSLPSPSYTFYVEVRLKTNSQTLVFILHTDGIYKFNTLYLPAKNDKAIINLVYILITNTYHNLQAINDSAIIDS